MLNDAARIGLCLRRDGTEGVNRLVVVRKIEVSAAVETPFGIGAGIRVCRRTAPAVLDDPGAVAVGRGGEALARVIVIPAHHGHEVVVRQGVVGVLAPVLHAKVRGVLRLIIRGGRVGVVGQRDRAAVHDLGLDRLGGRRIVLAEHQIAIGIIGVSIRSGQQLSGLDRRHAIRAVRAQSLGECPGLLPGEAGHL